MIKVTFIGHSAVCLEGFKTIYIDSFLSENLVANMAEVLIPASGEHVEI